MYKYYKKPSGYGKDSALTTAEKNALHLKLKKYCINQFKQSEKYTGKKYDGWGYFGKCSVNFHFGSGWTSSNEIREFHNRKSMQSRKLAFDNYGPDVESMLKKVATLLRQSGYKAEVEGRILRMWKKR